MWSEFVFQIRNFFYELRRSPLTAAALGAIVVLGVLLVIITPSGNDISYAGGKRRLDIYPGVGCAASGCPIVVFVHGGGWVRGDRRDDDVLRLAYVYSQKGVTFAAINFRTMPGSAFPAPVEDVAAAVSWAKQNGAKYNGNPARVFLMGAGSGAQLAALVGIDDDYLDKVGLRPVRDLAGVIAIHSISYDLTARRTSGRVQDEIVDRIIPHEILAKASPMQQVEAWHAYPPFLFLAANNDSEAATQASQFAAKLRANSSPAQLVTKTYPDEKKLYLVMMRI